KVIETDPGFTFGHLKLFELYLSEGRKEAAAEAYLKYLTLSSKSDAMIAAYRKAYEKKGPQGIYQKELEEVFQNQAAGSYRFPIHIATLYTLLGQKELAIQYLEMAYRQRNAEIMIIKNYTLFNPLRSDPRFQDLLRRIGLPD